MRLEIESIDISDVKLGEKTRVDNNIIYINLKELEEMILLDKRICRVSINIVNPGDSCRIVNVVDVIQPRCKIDREGEDFPGYLGKITTAGQGKTRSLNGIAVVLSNSVSKRPYSSLIDMAGKGAELSMYSKMKLMSVHPLPLKDTEERDFEMAVKLAGLKTAVYLARAAEGQGIDQKESYELDMASVQAKAKSSILPKVAYYYQLHTPQHDYQMIGDPILYGTSVTGLLPTVIHPNEVLDGAIVNTHTLRGLETYAIQNHAVIKELYKHHGKDLLFTGVVVGVASVDPVQRQRMCMMASNLIANVLGADGAILTKVHGGMPHIDLSQVGEASEVLGVKTTLFVELFQNLGTLSEAMIFSGDSLNAIINCGNSLEKIQLHRLDKILGGTEQTSIFNPDFSQKAGDPIVEIEGFLLAGAYAHIGGSNITSVEV
jgi:glycine reductase complex component B subunit alpha and beta